MIPFNHEQRWRAKAVQSEKRLLDYYSRNSGSIPDGSFMLQFATYYMRALEAKKKRGRKS